MTTRLTWTAAAWAAALAGFIGLQGCATVRTAPDHRFDTQPTGIAYFLPMRLARLTITQTPVSLEDLITDRDDKVAARTAARAAAAAATAKREQAQTALNAATAANRADLTRALETATADETKAKTAATAANAAVETATRDIYAASVNGRSCAFVPTVDLLPVQADRRRRFALQPVHNELRDDTLKIGLTPTSLLTTGDVTAVDQTGQVLVDLAGVAGAVAGVGRDGGGSDDDGCPGPAVWATIFDPAETAAVAEVNLRLKSNGLPFHLTTQVDGPPISRDRTTDAALPEAQVMEGVFYRSAAPLLLILNRTFEASEDTRNEDAAAGRDRIVTGPIQIPRVAAPPIQAEPALAAETEPDPETAMVPALAAVLILPQAGPVSRLSLPASPFVRTHHAYEFADGALISVSSERPGAVPSAAKVPLLALSAFTDAFAKAVAVRVDIRSTRISDDTAAIDAVIQDRLNTALMACLDAAGADTAAIRACASAYRGAGTPAP